MGFPVGDGDIPFYTQIKNTLYLAQINNLLSSARQLSADIGGCLVG